MPNLTITATLTPEEQTALYDALILRSQDLETNLPGSDRTICIHRLAAFLIEQIDYPVPGWLNPDI